MTISSSNKRTTTCIAVGIVVLLWLLYLEGGVNTCGKALVSRNFEFTLKPKTTSTSGGNSETRVSG
jgi:hypothetical protein